LLTQPDRPSTAAVARIVSFAFIFINLPFHTAHGPVLVRRALQRVYQAGVQQIAVNAENGEILPIA
jgi:hypothetical protein